MNTDAILNEIKQPFCTKDISSQCEQWYLELLSKISFNNPIWLRKEIIDQLQLLSNIGYIPATLSLDKIHTLGGCGWVAKRDTTNSLLSTKSMYEANNWFDTLRLNFVRFSHVLTALHVQMRWLSKTRFFSWSTYFYIIFVDIVVISKNIYSQYNLVKQIGLLHFLNAILNKGHRKDRMLSAAFWGVLGIVILSVPGLVGSVIGLVGLSLDLLWQTFNSVSHLHALLARRALIGSKLSDQMLVPALSEINLQIKQDKVQAIITCVFGTLFLASTIMMMFPSVFLAGVISTCLISSTGLGIKFYQFFNSKDSSNKERNLSTFGLFNLLNSDLQVTFIFYDQNNIAMHLLIPQPLVKWARDFISQKAERDIYYHSLLTQITKLNLDKQLHHPCINYTILAWLMSQKENLQSLNPALVKCYHKIFVRIPGCNWSLVETTQETDYDSQYKALEL